MRFVFQVAAMTLALGLSALAGAEDAGTPAATNVPGAQTPRIHSDRRITFTLKAPDASSCSLRAATD